MSEFQELKNRLREAFWEARAVKDRWDHPDYPLYQREMSLVMTKLEEAMHWVRDAEESIG